jgi:nitric oxide reductase NorE protein
VEALCVAFLSMAMADAVGQLTLGPRPETTESAKHVPGEPGVWILLFGDMVVFTVLFGVYLNHRVQHEALFAASQAALNRTLGAVNTLVLLCSSMLIVLAALAFRNPRLRHLTSRLTLAGAAVGSCFVVVKVMEYHEKVSAGLTPSTNEFFMYYFVLTGLHLAHVVIGLIVLTVLSRLVRNKHAPTPTQIALFESGACFWHMVDLLWLIIFPLIFLVH